jgi:hypothetical protein
MEIMIDENRDSFAQMRNDVAAKRKPLAITVKKTGLSEGFRACWSGCGKAKPSRRPKRRTPAINSALAPQAKLQIIIVFCSENAH